MQLLPFAYHFLTAVWELTDLQAPFRVVCVPGQSLGAPLTPWEESENERIHTPGFSFWVALNESFCTHIHTHTHTLKSLAIY